MANAAYVASSFGQTLVGVRSNTAVTLGVSPTSGQLIVFLLDCPSGQTVTVSGFAEHASSPVAWTTGRTARFFTKISNGTEGTTITSTHGSLNTYAIAFVVDHVNPTATIDFFASGTTATTLSPTASGTTTQANVLLISLFSYANNAGTVTEPASFTEFGDKVNTYGATYLLQAAAGGTGSITWTTTTNDDTITILFGVKSEVGVTTGTQDVATAASIAGGHSYVMLRGTR